MDAAIKNDELAWVPQTIEMLANHCNDRKLAAKTVSDKSAEMFLSLFIRQAGPLVVDGVIIQVMDHAMDCVLSNMGITKRVYVNRNEDIDSFEYQNLDGSLTLSIRWKGHTVPQRLRVFDSIQLSLEPFEKSSFEFKANLIKPQLQ